MVEGPQDGVHKALDEEGFEEAKEDVVFLQEANDAHLPGTEYQARNKGWCVGCGRRKREGGTGKRRDGEMRRRGRRQTKRVRTRSRRYVTTLTTHKVLKATTDTAIKHAQHLHGAVTYT